MAEREGQQLGNYRLIRLLGRGGFADVYVGEHLYLHTKAAIKVLQSRLASSELQGFLTEARIIANLTHPRIIRVLDFGVENDTPFLVMDYAPHGTLRQYYPKGTRLPLRNILAYVKQIAEALQYAHDNKLIHRDIKPENMLLGHNHDVLLSDFGIAIVTQSSRFQSTQEVIGTAAYMAPEQLQGKPRPASDQYALGIVVYEWLTGDLPFQGTFTEVASQHLFVPPVPLRHKLPDISADVEEVMQMVLAKDPQKRFMTVQAFATALEQANLLHPDVTIDSAGNLPTVLAPPPNQPTRLSTSANYSETISVTPPGSQIRQNDAPTEAGQFLLTGVKATSAGKARALQHGVSRRGVLVGLVGLVVGGGITWLALSQRLNTNSPARSTTPSASSTSSTSKTPTTVSTTSAAPSIGTTINIFSGHSDQVVALGWSNDGQRIASGSEDHTVQVWNAANGSNALVYQHSKQVYTTVWSPNGTLIASGGEDFVVKVWNPTNGATVSSYNGHSGPVHSVTWSPDGSRIASASADKTVQVWNAASGNLLFTYNAHTDAVWAVAWSLDGSRIASASFDHTVQLWDANTGRNILTYQDPASSGIRAVAWSRDGQMIASGGDGSTVQVWNAATGNILLTYRKHTDHIEDVEWSPDGQTLASASKDHSVRVWNANTGGDMFIYKLHQDIVWSLGWSPDGKRIASASGDRTVRVWEAT